MEENSIQSYVGEHVCNHLYTSGRHGAKLAFVWGHVSGYLTNVSNVVWAQTSGALAAMLITMYNKVDLPELVFFLWPNSLYQEDAERQSAKQE